MKNLTLLFVLASACLFGQTKEEAFGEMNAILKKGEGKTVAKEADGKEVKITKQVVYPQYELEMRQGGTPIYISVKDMRWDAYNHGYKTASASAEGFLSYSIVFDAAFNISMRLSYHSENFSDKQLMVYIKEADIERFEALLKIVSGKE